jgi:23S rRNA pseudouridine1911/1915/1917 synthase
LEKVLSYKASSDDIGKRIDQYLAQNESDISRTRLKNLILNGSLKLLDEIIIDPSYRIKENDIFNLLIPEAKDPTPKAENIKLEIIFEDEDLVVVNKPKGLVVHPAPGNQNKTLVNALINHCGSSLSGIGGERRPGIVHRLDKDTSGLIVVAKNDKSHNGLSEQFKNHGRDGKLIRSYKAIVWGVPKFSSGSISTYLGRSSKNRKKMAIYKDEKSGRKIAITHWKILKKNILNNISLIECRLETGRTHQIRVHLDHISHPVIGDPLYGQGYKTRIGKLDDKIKILVDKLENKQALHADQLGFEHPLTKENHIFQVDPPKEMIRIIKLMQVHPFT